LLDDAAARICENVSGRARITRGPIRGIRLEREGPVQDKRVKMYTLSTCSHCRAAKKLLGDLGVRYEFVDVDLLSGNERAAMIEEVKRHNPACSFPTIIIGDTVIVGNREDRIKEALGLK
jgi:glutaredoxin-like protein NrdH